MDVLIYVVCWFGVVSGLCLMIAGVCLIAYFGCILWVSTFRVFFLGLGVCELCLDLLGFACVFGFWDWILTLRFGWVFSFWFLRLGLFWL